VIRAVSAAKFVAVKPIEMAAIAKPWLATLVDGLEVLILP